MNENYTLLVVDDNEMNRDLLTRRLQRQKYNIEVAEDGKEALEKIEAKKYDLILLDIMMPGIDGIEVLEILRQTYTPLDLPVIMVTAKDQSEDIVGALKRGANDYVTKPLDFPIVLARVQTHLNQCRLAALNDEFLGIASHDLKKPLAVILDVAHTIKEDCDEGNVKLEEIPMFLDLIAKSGTVMKSIIEDFLDLHAVEGGYLKLSKKAIDLNELVQEVMDNNIEYSKHKNILIEHELMSDLPKVQADPRRLNQVIDNFIGNAIKFSPSETTVKVMTRATENKIILEVLDQGPGLTSDDLEKVFGKFSQLSNVPTGGEKSTGLGLSICKQLIDLHKGEIVAENMAHGAKFWFSLPREEHQLIKPA